MPIRRKGGLPLRAGPETHRLSRPNGDHRCTGPFPQAQRKPAPAGTGAGLPLVTDLPVCGAPSRTGGANVGRFLLPPALTKALPPRRWQGPSPLPQRHAGIRTSRGPKPPASARPAHGGRFSRAGPGAGLPLCGWRRSLRRRRAGAGETRVAFPGPARRDNPFPRTAKSFPAGRWSDCCFRTPRNLTLTDPSRMITQTLIALRFSWQDRFLRECGGGKTVRGTVFPPNGTGCDHADSSSQSGDDDTKGKGRQSRPATSLHRPWRNASARPSRPSVSGSTGTACITAATCRITCRPR